MSGNDNLALLREKRHTAAMPARDPANRTLSTILMAIPLKAVQLERVRHLLHTTNLSIVEISRLANFRSENHLNRFFKATYGMTMSAAHHDSCEK